MEINYVYEIDDAGMFGGDADMDGVDVQSSYRKFEDDVFEALKREYPDAEISVSSGAPRITVLDDDGNDDDRETRNVSDLIHVSWSSFNWVVYSEE